MTRKKYKYTLNGNIDTVEVKRCHLMNMPSITVICPCGASLKRDFNED